MHGTMLPREPKMRRVPGGFVVAGYEPPLWTPDQNGIWEHGSFDVPIDTPEERVEFKFDVYMAKLQDIWEGRGFTVLHITRPRRETSMLRNAAMAPDRKGYFMWAFVRRRPVTATFKDVPDELAPQLIAAGMKLTS